MVNRFAFQSAIYFDEFISLSLFPELNLFANESNEPIKRSRRSIFGYRWFVLSVAKSLNVLLTFKMAHFQWQISIYDIICLKETHRSTNEIDKSLSTFSQFELFANINHNKSRKNAVTLGRTEIRRCYRCVHQIHVIETQYNANSSWLRFDCAIEYQFQTVENKDKNHIIKRLKEAINRLRVVMRIHNFPNGLMAIICNYLLITTFDGTPSRP